MYSNLIDQQIYVISEDTSIEGGIFGISTLKASQKQSPAHRSVKYPHKIFEYPGFSMWSKVRSIQKRLAENKGKLT